jgi:hypothetical protein
LYFPTNEVNGVTKLELKVFDEVVILLNAEDSRKLSQPIDLKLKKLRIFLWSKGSKSK